VVNLETRTPEDIAHLRALAWTALIDHRLHIGEAGLGWRVTQLCDHPKARARHRRHDQGALLGEEQANFAGR
jgi:hypothetical protein